MKSALLLSERHDLFDATVAALKRLAPAMGAVVTTAEAYARLTDDGGRKVTVFGAPSDEALRCARAEGWTVRPGVETPDLASATMCVVECRWEDLFARFAREVAVTAETPCWVMDDDGVIWDAADVDPDVVQL